MVFHLRLTKIWLANDYSQAIVANLVRIRFSQSPYERSQIYFRGTRKNVRPMNRNVGTLESSIIIQNLL